MKLPPGGVHYESSDVKPGAVGKALAGLIVVTVVIVALLIPAFTWLRGRAQKADPPPPPMGRHEPGRLPAEPRLQTTSAQDLAATLVADQRLLAGYGWVDEQKGIVHIPIDVAMRMVAERGLPAAAPAASPGASPAPAPASPAAAVPPEAHR